MTYKYLLNLAQPASKGTRRWLLKKGPSVCPRLPSANLIYLSLYIYIYNLAVNNPHELICYKTQPNQSFMDHTIAKTFIHSPVVGTWLVYLFSVNNFRENVLWYCIHLFHQFESYKNFFCCLYKRMEAAC